MSEETTNLKNIASTSHDNIRDGNLDVFYDLSQQTRKEKWKFTQLYLCLVDSHASLTTASNLQLQFDLYFLQHSKKSCVKAVNNWKRDGMISVATTACLYCIQINNARPYPARRPPFSCLVRSRPDIGDLRSDGSQICACCSALSRTGCRAWGGTHHKTAPDANKGKDKEAATASSPSQKIVIKRQRQEPIQQAKVYHVLDDGSDLSSIEDNEDVNSEDSSVPLARLTKKKRRKSSVSKSQGVESLLNKVVLEAKKIQDIETSNFEANLSDSSVELNGTIPDKGFLDMVTRAIAVASAQSLSSSSFTV